MASSTATQPEIIIVVDKLLTGFDAPRNTVLYLTRQLKDHTLLQAIARVNRLYDGKDFGYIIDYCGVLQNLNKAFDLYGKLEEFDQADLDMTLTDVAEEIRKASAAALRPSGSVQGHQEQAGRGAVRAVAGATRSCGSSSTSGFGVFRILAIALSSIRFMEETPDAKIEKYPRPSGVLHELLRACRGGTPRWSTSRNTRPRSRS